MGPPGTGVIEVNNYAMPMQIIRTFPNPLRSVNYSTNVNLDPHICGDDAGQLLDEILSDIRDKILRLDFDTPRRR